MNAKPEQKRLHELQIDITLQAPWLVHGNDPGRWGLDAVHLRAPDGLRRTLPGTLLLGRVREAWQEWAAEKALGWAHDPAQWLGPNADADETEDAGNSGTTGRRQPRFARLHVDDLLEVCAPEALQKRQLSTVTRLQMDALAGAGKDGMLLAIEQEEPPGTKIAFSGVWRAWLAESEAPALANAIGKALRWQSRIGAFRNIGFGEVSDVGVVVRPYLRLANNNATAAAFVAGGSAGPRGLSLAFTQSLAVGNRRINGNTFESSDVIPGAAIKAALAKSFKERMGHVPEWFDALRISHALPAAGHKRPAPLPLSLVTGKSAQNTDCIWDLAHSDAAPLDAKHHAAAFQLDWKPDKFDKADADSKRGWGNTQRYLRVRTAIESGRAKDKSLFAYEAVVAAANGEGDNTTITRWMATLDLPKQFDNAAHWQEIFTAFTTAPLGPLGKTDAFCEAHLLPSTPVVWPSQMPETGHTEVRLQLITPALLTSTHSVLNNTSCAPADLQQIYQTAFDQIALATAPGMGNALTLKRFFATQQMAGGDYLHKRFSGGSYLPYVLTQPGSVFVFVVNEPANATELLGLWQKHGLPLSADVKQHHGGDWRSNPYLPQNGYGEVVVNAQTGFARGHSAAQETKGSKP
jgi:hypothetical protein